MSTVRRFTKEDRRIRAYATFCQPGACVRNCMTKMLLGLECYAYVPEITPAMVQTAVDALTDDGII